MELDESRHARERQHPVVYLRNSYYENWLAGLSTLLVEKGLVSPEELVDGVARQGVGADLAARVVRGGAGRRPPRHRRPPWTCLLPTSRRSRPATPCAW
ncbi:MAG: nitrile hydratase subunit beta [Gammaproteobacteria bacterium]|nr:nitrile hydratase subunit beta [Gammaproteobacteria bacterium]